MKKILVLFLMTISLQAEAQFCPECFDPNIIPNEFQPCGTDFSPVCGCDGKTYRNICSAIFWGGLCGYTDGPCSGFYIDMYPTAVTYFDTYFNYYVRPAGPMTVYIYDTFGRVQYQRNISINSPNFSTQQTGPERIPVQNLELGIYIFVAVVGGEVQYIKFAKCVDQEEQ